MALFLVKKKRAVVGARARAGPFFFSLVGQEPFCTPEPERDFYGKKTALPPKGHFAFFVAEGVVAWERLGWAGEAALKGRRGPESGEQ